MGDANRCAKKWMDEDYKNKKNLNDLVNDFFLESSTSQIVQEFTRSEIVQGNQVSASCIDHYYTNVPNKMAQPDVCATGTSDNLGVVVTKFIKVNNKGPQTIKKRCYRLFDIESFLSDTLNSSLSPILCLEIFILCLLTCYEVL